MNYKGNYSADTSYSVGDVAVLDNVAYELFEAAAAGTSPHNTHKWRRVIQPMQDMVMLFNSMLGSGVGGGLPEVTTADNGDVLTVVAGAWAKADPPSGLPTVTSDDNGDVLTVVEGAWAKASPSGGGILNVIGTYDNEDNIVLDKTWNEINNASFTSISVTDNGTKTITIVSSIYVDEGTYYIVDNLGSSYTADSASGYPIGSGGK